MSMTTGQVREKSEGASAQVEGLLRFRAYRTGRGKKSRGAGDKKEQYYCGDGSALRMGRSRCDGCRIVVGFIFGYTKTPANKGDFLLGYSILNHKTSLSS